MTTRTAICSLAAALALGGCTASGVIQARMTKPTGGAPVTMRYQTDRFTNDGTLTVTTPDGQTFSGRFLQITSETDGETLDPYWGGWGVGWDGWGPWTDDYGPYIAGADVPTFIKNYSGKVIATLFGDRGGRMRCRFRLADPEHGMTGGGIGECQTGTGEKLDAQF